MPIFIFYIDVNSENYKIHSCSEKIFIYLLYIRINENDHYSFFHFVNFVDHLFRFSSYKYTYENQWQ